MKLERIKGILKNKLVDDNTARDVLISTIIFKAESVCEDVLKYENSRYNDNARKIDKIITSKVFGIPIMIAFLGLIFWITIVGANYPSELLSQFFGWLQLKIEYVFEILSLPQWIKGVLIDG